MRNVAARVKAARELVKRLAAEEEGEADARGGVLGEGLSGDGGGFTGSQYIETEHGGDVESVLRAYIREEVRALVKMHPDDAENVELGLTEKDVFSPAKGAPRGGDDER